MKHKTLNKQKMAFIVVIILLILAVGYIFVDKYQEVKTAENIKIYEQGFQEGFTQAVSTLIDQASTCKPVPVRKENATVNLIAIECLQEPEN